MVVLHVRVAENSFSCRSGEPEHNLQWDHWTLPLPLLATLTTCHLMMSSFLFYKNLFNHLISILLTCFLV